MILSLFSEPDAKVRIARKLGRADIVADIALENLEIDQHAAAHDAFRAGYLDDAYTLYTRVDDWDMALLSAYILGDEGKLREVIAKAPGPATRYRAAVILDDTEAALACLESPSLRCAFMEARGGADPAEF